MVLQIQLRLYLLIVTVCAFGKFNMFAKLDEVAAVPCKSEACKSGYATFLTKNKPRAFATSGKGPWSWAEMGEDPLKRALDNCNRLAKEDVCKLYAVDDDIVWAEGK